MIVMEKAIKIIIKMKKIKIIFYNKKESDSENERVI